jgi:hypothetical protein
MARVMPDPEEEGEGGQRRPRGLDPPPEITVLGIMDGNLAIRLHWKHGMHVISNSRFKFMREDLEVKINDDPENYLF